MIEEEFRVLRIGLGDALHGLLVQFEHLDRSVRLAVELVRNSQGAPPLSYVSTVFEQDLAALDKSVELPQLHLHVGGVSEDVEIILQSQNI